MKLNENKQNENKNLTEQPGRDEPQKYRPYIWEKYVVVFLIESFLEFQTQELGIHILLAGDQSEVTAWLQSIEEKKEPDKVL